MSSSIEEQLRIYATAVSREIGASAERPSAIPVAFDRHRGRWMVAFAVASVALFLAVVGIQRAEDSSPVETASTPSVESPILAASERFAGPLDARRAPVLVPLSDGRIVVWGGEDESQEPVSDGAIFDPRSGLWQMFDAPETLLPARGRSVGAALAGELIIYRGRSGAAWNVDTGGWRELAEAPAEVNDLHVVRNKLVSMSGAAAYDPISDTWSVVEAIDEFVRSGLAVAAAVRVDTSDPLYIVRSDGAVIAYAVDSTKQISASSAICDCDWISAVVFDGQLIVTSQQSVVHVLPTSGGEWQSGPSIPLASTLGRPGLSLMGSFVVASGEDNALAILEEGTWLAVPGAGVDLSLSHDGKGWGTDGDPLRLVSFDPRLALKSATFSLGGWQLATVPGETVRFDVSGESSGFSNELRIEVEQSDGGQCFVVAREPFLPGPPADVADPSGALSDLTIDCGSDEEEGQLASRLRGLESDVRYTDAVAVFNQLTGENPVLPSQIGLADAGQLIDGSQTDAWLADLDLHTLFKGGDHAVYPGLICDSLVPSKAVDVVSFIAVEDAPSDEVCARTRVHISVDANHRAIQVDIFSR